MNAKLTVNETIRESISLALIKLMKKKPFSQITISEIVKVAGVSRSSFYRNYESKEQILISYIHDIYAQFFRTEGILSVMPEGKDVQQFLLPRFRFVKQHRDFFTVLRKNNLLYYVFEQTEADLIVLLTGQNSSLPQYYRSMFSGACAGILRQWIDNSFQDSEEEMVAIFLNFPMNLN